MNLPASRAARCCAALPATRFNTWIWRRGEKGLLRQLPGVVIGLRHAKVPGKANVVTDSAAIAGMVPRI